MDIFIKIKLLGLIICLLMSSGMIWADDPTATFTPTFTPTATFTPTVTFTPSSTQTPIVVTSIVTQPPIIINQLQPPEIIVITQPAVIVQSHAVVVASAIPPVPSVTSQPTEETPSDLYGWSRFESKDLVKTLGIWDLRTAQNASESAYHESKDSGALLRYPFEGNGFRVAYRLQAQGGSFQVKLDGQPMGVWDTASQVNAVSVATQSFIDIPDGYHLLEIQILSSGKVGIDFVEVFTSPPLVNGAGSLADTSVALIEAVSFVQVAAPPTPLPSPTPRTPTVILIDIVIGYDLNFNDAIDPSEGSRGISIRAVDSITNTVLSSAVTDDSGFVRMQVIAENDLVLLVPLLGETLDIRIGRNSDEPLATTWTILLESSNLPGLLP